MRIGINVGYSGSTMSINMDLIKQADDLGLHSVWAAEAYGSDAVTPLAWIAGQTKQIKVGTAIMQIPARTPAMTAMTATTLDQLSGGRFLLGIGASGPQVVEGWHGTAYGKPMKRTREYIEILRKIFAREEPLTYEGPHYQIPYQGEDATGLGKPLKSILHPRQLPIYVAAIGPKSVSQTAEIADGWLPIFFSPQRGMDLYREGIEAGFARAGNGKGYADFDIAPNPSVIITDDVQAGIDMLKPMLALYIGGMGARGKNFYNDLATRYGYEAEAKKIQDLYLDGKKKEATAEVPNDLVDDVALIGPAERIRDRIQLWKDSPVNTIICGVAQPEAIPLLAELNG